MAGRTLAEVKFMDAFGTASGLAAVHGHTTINLSDLLPPPGHELPAGASAGHRSSAPPTVIPDATAWPGVVGVNLFKFIKFKFNFNPRGTQCECCGLQQLVELVGFLAPAPEPLNLNSFKFQLNLWINF